MNEEKKAQQYILKRYESLENNEVTDIKNKCYLV